MSQCQCHSPKAMQGALPGITFAFCTVLALDVGRLRCHRHLKLQSLVPLGMLHLSAHELQQKYTEMNIAYQVKFS